MIEESVRKSIKNRPCGAEMVSVYFSFPSGQLWPCSPDASALGFTLVADASLPSAAWLASHHPLQVGAGEGATGAFPLPCGQAGTPNSDPFCCQSLPQDELPPGRAPILGQLSSDICHYLLVLFALHPRGWGQEHSLSIFPRKFPPSP